MWTNYLKVALRNLRREKGYAFINLSGLAVGLAAFLLILAYVADELSYDRFHEKAERIFRVTSTEESERTFRKRANTSALLAGELESSFPQVQEAVRLHRPEKVLVSRENRQYVEEQFFYADSSFFEVFTFPLVEGDPSSALGEPGSVVLTEEAARKYFGEQDPIGKTLTLENEKTLTVTGVVKDVPSSSHVQFDMLASFSMLEPIDRYYDVIDRTWTYLLLGSTQHMDSLSGRLAQLPEKPGWWQEAGIQSFHLQPLTDIHLHSDLFDEIRPDGSIQYVYLFGLAALLLLGIAIVNFVNLSTARSLRRAREIGMRKAIGADRRQLITQFLGETTLVASLAGLLAVGLIYLFFPVFNQLTGKALSFATFDLEMTAAAVLGTIVATALLGGSYPAFYLSRFRPADILRGRGSTETVSSGAFRKGLVVTQFTICIGLIVGALSVYQQVDFLQSKPLGYYKEQVIVLPIRGQIGEQFNAFRNELTGQPDVVNVSRASGPPTDPQIGQITVRSDSFDVHYVLGDANYVETMGIEILRGRNFAGGQDAFRSVILTQSMVDKLGWEDPLGREFNGLMGPAKVIGVVNDFHTLSLRERVHPAVLQLAPPYFQHVLVRVKGRDVPETLDGLEETWASFTAGRPFEYAFLDEQIDQMYRSEQRMGAVIGLFAALAVLIACLGLFGLAALTTRQRIREISIRKVLGATVPGLVGLLSRDFMRLVAIALVLGMPIAYLLVEWWLQDFAYRTNIGPATFLLAGGVAIAVAFLTVSYQSIKAALTDPADSLRYE